MEPDPKRKASDTDATWAQVLTDWKQRNADAEANAGSPPPLPDSKKTVQDERERSMSDATARATARAVEEHMRSSRPVQPYDVAGAEAQIQQQRINDAMNGGQRPAVRNDITEEYDENGKPLAPREKTIYNLGERMGNAGGDWIRKSHPNWVATPDQAASNDAKIQMAKNKAEMWALPKAAWMRQHIPGMETIGKISMGQPAKPVEPVDGGEIDTARRRDIKSFTRSNASDQPTKVYTEADIESVKKALENAKKKK